MPDRVHITIPSFPRCPDCSAEAHVLTFRPIVDAEDTRVLSEFAWRCPNGHMLRREVLMPEGVMRAILGALSGWLILWVVTRRRPKSLPFGAFGVVLVAAMVAREHPTWSDSQPVGAFMAAVAAGLVVAASAYWLLARSPES